jgi:hypothetical protein
MRRWPGRPSPATVMSAIALFVSLGGVGYAAATIGSAQIRDNSVSSKDIKNRTIRSKDIGRKTLSALRGRKGATGERGQTGPAGAAGTSMFDGTIPSGKTVTGAWGGEYAAVTGGPGDEIFAIGFPVKAPSALTSGQVNTAPDSRAADPDIACVGTLGAPTAPAGKVCIYIGSPTAASDRVEGFKLVSPFIDPTVPGDELGFSISVRYNTMTTGDPTVGARGTWAYTAP